MFRFFVFPNSIQGFDFGCSTKYRSLKLSFDILLNHEQDDMFRAVGPKTISSVYMSDPNVFPDFSRHFHYVNFHSAFCIDLIATWAA